MKHFLLFIHPHVIPNFRGKQKEMFCGTFRLIFFPKSGCYKGISSAKKVKKLKLHSKGAVAF